MLVPYSDDDYLEAYNNNEDDHYDNGEDCDVVEWQEWDDDGDD